MAGWHCRPPRCWCRVIAATLLIATASHLLTIALSQACVRHRPVAPITAAFYQRLTFSGQLRNLFILILAVHAAWVAIYLAFAMQRRRYQADLRQAQLGEALQAAELRLLKSQLNPHFLFNALNGLRSLIADEPDRARDAVTQLARTLRYTLASGEEDLVSLERELEMVDDYLALESMRLADRLRVEREIDPAARTARIPAMLLQTLVENAIKHGIAAAQAGRHACASPRSSWRRSSCFESSTRGRTTRRARPSAGRRPEEFHRAFAVVVWRSRAACNLDLSQPGAGHRRSAGCPHESARRRR